MAGRRTEHNVDRRRRGGVAAQLRCSIVSHHLCCCSSCRRRHHRWWNTEQRKNTCCSNSLREIERVSGLTSHWDQLGHALVCTNRDHGERGLSSSDKSMNKIIVNRICALGRHRSAHKYTRTYFSLLSLVHWCRFERRYNCGIYRQQRQSSNATLLSKASLSSRASAAALVITGNRSKAAAYIQR